MFIYFKSLFRKNINYNLFLSILVLGCSQLTSNAQVQIGGDIDGKAADDQSGRSISMPDAHTVAIGSPNNDGNGTNSGHVRIYRWNDSTWVQKGTNIEGDTSGDQSGYSVSMPDSNTVAIGAPYNDGNGNNSGHVRIYRWDGSSWVQKGRDIDGEVIADCSGWAVSMPDSNTIAIGALYNDGNGTNSGHVRIYQWVGNAWKQKGLDIDGEAEINHSGHSVDMPDSNTIAIGAPYNDGKHGIAAGHVRIYRWIGNAWVQRGLDIDGESSPNESGYSVNMADSNTVAIGAPYNDGNGYNSGHVRIYRWNGNAWKQKGADIDGESSGDFSGQSVDMPDSNTVAIGAPDNDGNGSNSGHVRVYRWNGSIWGQIGVDIEGDTIGDNSGYSVCMPVSNIIVIGAIHNSDSGSSAGHVRVFTFNTTDTIVVMTCDSFVSPSSNYTWIRSGTYIDTISNSIGYDSIITINLTIDTINTQVIVSNDSLIAADTNATYQWLDCGNNYLAIPGATNRVFEPTASGNYAVSLDKLNCADTSTCYNIVVTGLHSFKNQRENITIYPNPSKGLFTIDYPFTNESKVYTVTDINGKVVKEGVINKEKTQLNLAEFVSGIYLLRIENAVVKLVLD